MEEDHQWAGEYGDEPYVYLLRDNMLDVRDDFSYTETVHLVLKIQKEGGKKLGEYPLYFDRSRERIEEIEAFIITPDGEKLEYTKIHEDVAPGGFAVYSDERVKTITLPGVCVGCIMDIRFKTVHEKPMVEKCFWEEFYFTGTVPIKYSRRILTVPNDLPIRNYIQQRGDKTGNSADRKENPVYLVRGT